MKKYLLSAGAAGLAVFLISWGMTGHRIIGRIAENHLTPKARASVQALLGDQTLADVASWADEVRGSDAAYRQTAPWHFINVPLGLSFDDFKQQVENSSTANVYGALLKQEAVLKDPGAPAEQKAVALKFIVHFVGDIHQPMHVSRAEDKGGNTLQVQYNGQGTNLHSLWDTKLLEHQGLDYQQLAEKYDHLSAEQIKKWQGDRQIVWAWESYQISTRLYAEIGETGGRTIDDSYYQAHLPIIENRIEKAGIRLAGILNAIFEQSPVTGPAGATTHDMPGNQTAKTIDIADAAAHIGEQVTLSAKVFGFKELGSMTLVNLGAAYPNQQLTLVLRNDAKEMVSALDGKVLTVTGKLILYKDKPEIVVTEPDRIRLQ